VSFARVGVLRRRLTLEAPVRTPGEGGAATITWSALAQVWAAITPVSGRELVRGDGMTARMTHEVLIRYRSGVRPEMRFTSGSRVFEIRVVMDEDERRRWLACLCEERLP
jgi:SPP1 family predicted phage head-tail adaptor